MHERARRAPRCRPNGKRRHTRTTTALAVDGLPPELRAVVLAHLPPTALCRFAGVRRHALADADAVSVGAVSALRAADPADVATRLAHTSQRVERHVATELGLLPKDKKAPPHRPRRGRPRRRRRDHRGRRARRARRHLYRPRGRGLVGGAHPASPRATASGPRPRPRAARGEAQAERLAQIAAWLRTEQPYGPDVLDYGAFTQRMQAMTAQIGDYVHERPYLYVPGSVLQYVSNVPRRRPSGTRSARTSSPTATASSTSTRASSTSWPTSSPVASSCPSRPKRSRGLGASSPPTFAVPPGPDDPAPSPSTRSARTSRASSTATTCPPAEPRHTGPHRHRHRHRRRRGVRWVRHVRCSLPLRHVAGGPCSRRRSHRRRRACCALTTTSTRGTRPPTWPACARRRPGSRRRARRASTSTARPPRSSRCRSVPGREGPDGDAARAAKAAGPAVAHRRRRRPRRTAPRRVPPRPAQRLPAPASPRGLSDPASVSVRPYPPVGWSDQGKTVPCSAVSPFPG